MRTLGAEIRTINISQEKALKAVKAYITNQDMTIEREVLCDDNVLQIISSNKNDSCIKSWLKGNPQIVEWLIIAMNGFETRIEARFGLHKKYWIWFFSIFLTLIFFTGLFIIKFKLASKNFHLFGRPEIMYDAILYAIYSSFLVILNLFFISKSKEIKHDEYLNNFNASLNYRHENCNSNKIVSNVIAPHIIYVIFICIVSISFYFFEEWKQSSAVFEYPSSIVFITFVFIMIAFLLMLFFAFISPYLQNRLAFALIGIVVVIPLLLFYFVPFIISYSIYYADLFGDKLNIQYAIENNSNSIILGELLSWKNFPANKYYVLFIFSIFIIYLCIFFILTNVQTLGRNVLNWKNTLFSKGNKTYHTLAIDSGNYRKNFSISIFLIWFFLSIVLYYQAFSIIGIFWYSITGSQILFLTEVTMPFCIITTTSVCFLLSPFIKITYAIIFARILLFLYCIPFLWISYKLFKKNLLEFIKNMRKIRNCLLNSQKLEFRINDKIKAISNSFNLKTPGIILTKSKLPMISTKYIGIPYFRSYIFISEGCFKLKGTELEGLLAHEIYHIKSHTILWHFLNFFSKYTFFGTGFLSVTLNSYLWELEADYNAALWVYKNGNIHDFINALRIVSPTKVGNELSIMNTSKISPKIDKKGFSRSATIERFFDNIKILIQIYLGDEILSYIHPNLDERIKRILSVTT